MIGGLCRWIIRVFFREVVVEGRENLPAGRPVIFTPNHPNSLLDPVLLFALSPTSRVRFVAKAPLFRVPVFGWILRSMGAIPVVRKFEAQGEVDYSKFFESCVAALAAGDSIVIFPEGRSLPQPHLAPLKTGPARLFFMAREQSAGISIVPIGLNYERGAVFRSSVLISVAPPVDTTGFVKRHESEPAGAVQDLTSEIGRILEERVFQAENYRDRELMLLLERLSSQERDASWRDRLSRLKQYEKALESLHVRAPQQIENLRSLLARYQRLSASYGMTPAGTTGPPGRSPISYLISIIGLALAAAGSILNWIPYRIVDLLVRSKDESEAATFKVLYALLLFPFTYVIEAWLLARWLGWQAAALFAVLILPLSYFTLLFFEWREEMHGESKPKSLWFAWNTSRRVTDQLNRLQMRITAEVEALAAKLADQP